MLIMKATWKRYHGWRQHTTGTTATVSLSLRTVRAVVASATLETAVARIGSFRSLVHADNAAIESGEMSIWIRSNRNAVEHLLLVVHGLHGGFGLRLASEADEPKSTAAQSVMVLDNNLVFVRLCHGETRLGIEFSVQLLRWFHIERNPRGESDR